MCNMACESPFRFHFVGIGVKTLLLLGQCSTDDRAVLIDNIRNWILTDDPLPTQSDLSVSRMSILSRVMQVLKDDSEF